MTSVKDVMPQATQTPTGEAEVVSDPVRTFEQQAEAVIQAVVEVAVAVSEALVAGTWPEFFAKLQEVFEAMGRVRSLHAESSKLEDALPALNQREKERIAASKERVELALAETSAMRKLVIQEARRRQQHQVTGNTGVDELPTPPKART